MMSQPRMGVMIDRLFGSKKPFDFADVAGKVIAQVDLVINGDGALVVTFDDGSTLTLKDDGRSCCERRYMTTDDDLSSFVGATITGGGVQNALETLDDYGDPHETAFMRLQTTKGPLVVCTHNEHNGYYGGFALKADYQPKV